MLGGGRGEAVLVEAWVCVGGGWGGGREAES